MPTPTLDELSASLAHHETFVVLAETLAGWQSPTTPEGRAVLERHYQWGNRQRAIGALLFAGPVDVESLGPGAPNPVGRVTGLLVFRAATRSDAETIAYDDPFHVAGFRRNHVHSWSIRFVQPALGAALAASLWSTS
jgi:uncharacterized protein YciI